MGLDFDVLEFCRKLRTSNRPPYTCPVIQCGKFYKSMCGLQYHLVNFDHDSPQTSSQSSFQSSLQSSFLSLSQSSLLLSSSQSSFLSPSQYPSQYSSQSSVLSQTLTEESSKSASTAVLTPPHSVKKRKKSHGRWSHTPRLKTQLKVMEPVVTPPREGLTYAEAQKLVEFEINGKLHRINVSQTVRMVSKKDFEAHCDNLMGLGVSQSVLSLAKSQEAVTKLPEPCFKVLDNYNIADAPTMPNSYVRFIERSAEEMDGEIEYDMDEEDAAWLTIVNQKRSVLGIPEVSIDNFELLMDRLEKESYFQ